MEHQVMINQYNRRNFLKQAALGTGALAGLPSLDLPLLAADSGSRIEALELLVLKQNSEQRRVLKVISSSGAAGYADFPDLRCGFTIVCFYSRCGIERLTSSS